MSTDDVRELESLVRTFFAAFTSDPDCAARLDRLRGLFVPGATVVRAGGVAVVYTVDEFIEPRRVLLTEGTLRGLREWPGDGRLDVVGDIGHWFGAYRKAGEQDGVPFSGHGTKSLQFVRMPDGWRISAAAWHDEDQDVPAASTTRSTSSPRRSSAGGCARIRRHRA